MTRRIIYILLAVVVVLAVVLGIRWWLNRDTGQDTVTDGTAAVVDDTGSYPVAETTTDQTAPGGDTGTTGETAVTDSSAAGTETTDTAVTEGTTPEGEQTAVGDGEDSNAGDAAEQPTDATTPDSALGGTAESGDPNAGGGVVEAGPADTSGETADATTGATTGDTAATSEAAGTGGVVGVVPPIAILVTPGQSVRHTVQNNEWLVQLARCYGTTVPDIRAANYIPVADLIYPGAVLTIPNPGSAGPITINEMPCFVYHTVQRGENLSRIAQDYGINLHWLARINAIYNYNYIQAGQVLVIPNPVPPELTTAPSAWR
ncbi:MAG: LysM peptidoglycan-binding domain-containing protein [Chloroflexi bacterium]|nr:LysM peptidoglycan-binding domain-containing protein [Chloroflexota bacterium]